MSGDFSARWRSALAVVLALLTACTPLGVWVYDDPTFNLHAASLSKANGAAGAVDSLTLVFAACNRNDFDMTVQLFESSLIVDGREIGHGRQATSHLLVIRDSVPVTVTLAMQAGWTQGAVERPIMLRSDLVLERPNGVRQLSLVQKGRLVVSGDAATLKGLQGRPCRPGISSLPDQFTRPVSPNQPGAASPGAINPP